MPGTGIAGLSSLRSRPKQERHIPWVYLGARLDSRNEADRILGAVNRLPLADLLADAQARLRRPFLDLVADVGEAQTDPLGWWSSRLSWKLWAASDLLLLICFMSIARDLERSGKEKGTPLLIVVEDPWLLAQMTGSEPAALGFEKLRLSGLGLLRRIWWLAKTLPAVLRQRNRRPAGKSNGFRPAAAICSFPLRSGAGKAESWRDLHLPGLEELLAENGWEVLRFAPAGCPAGFEEEMSARNPRFRSLAAYASPASIWRSVTATWRPVLPAGLRIDGMSVGRLLEREGRLDAARAAQCGHRFFYETLNALLAQERLSWIATCYENQPWEKLLALAARKHGVRVAGIQTAIISRDYHSYFFGSGDVKRMPLPDVLCASGPYAQELLSAEQGPPVLLWGAIRYQELAKRVSAAPEPSPPPRNRVLVVLPIHPPMCEDLLDGLRRAFPDGGTADSLTFTVRPHPLYPVDPARWGFKPAEQSSFQDAQKAQEESGLILFVGSTVGFEGMSRFRPVLRYRPELTLDPDAEAYGPAVPACDAHGLREALLKLVKEGPPAGWEGTCRATVLKLFAPFNSSAPSETFVLK